MGSILETKYPTLIQMADDSGRIPLRCVDDDDMSQVMEAFIWAGYSVKLHESLDYILVRK